VERPVKERLVGAAVLVAAAVILIPEMLSGPRPSRNQPADNSGEAPLKTYTIDLSQAGSTATAENAAPPAAIEEPAPPPEDVAASAESADAAEPALEESTPQAQSTPESAPVENQSGDATSEEASALEPPAPEPPQAEAPKRETVPVAAAPSHRDVAPAATPPAIREAPPAAGSEKTWAVQVASLDDQVAANRLSKQLREQGHDAFVMPFKKGGVTWYRVRIGPVKSRSAANEMLRKVKETRPTAILVPHP
jgi:cell division septation protein DedD